MGYGRLRPCFQFGVSTQTGKHAVTIWCSSASSNRDNEADNVVGTRGRLGGAALPECEAGRLRASAGVVKNAMTIPEQVQERKNPRSSTFEAHIKCGRKRG